MKIKKLTIHGFKSFPDRTHFAFPAGTSAIVGPNGCGKSNVVDAIRWVLGEQNARHLRGKLMEDLVFAGSDTRRPLGMAEVTLTLSNEEGKAPASYANFTEIEIQRRLYRSGESEYFINKVPSRLKDIVELFRDTGIGTRAYSIIEQGQVGWLVTAKPEERRAIFEEAAGINKYKHKKDAALRKLDATRQNLERVTDIISEVKRQLNSLNRQAKKAERYKALKEELKGLDLYLAHLEHRRMTEERARAEGELAGIEDKEVALSAEVSSKQGSVEELHLEYMQKEGEFKELKERVHETERLIQAGERAEELARIRIEELERTAERLALDIEELKAQRVLSEAEVAGLRTELGRLSELIEEEKASLMENESEVERLSEELRHKEDQLKREEAASLEVSAGLTEIKHSIQNCIREEEALRIKQARLETESNETSRLISEKEAPLEALKSGMAEASRRIESVEAEYLSAKKRLRGLEDENTRRMEEFKALKEELAAKRARLKTLEEMDANMEGLKQGVRTIIRERKDQGGLHGLVADVIETAHGYERAVEAALGDRLQYVIVESQKDGLEAVEYLRTSSNGRGSFIPLRDVRPGSTSDAAGGDVPEGARNLKDEVVAKNGYDVVIRNLLSDVLLVDDLGSAIEIWRQNGIQRTLVTPEGEMIDPQGVITGGRSNGSDGGILLKKKEIKELKADIAGLEERLRSLEEKIRDTESVIEDMRGVAERCKERLHSEDIERINREGELARIEDEITRLRSRLDELSAELKSTEDELGAIRDKKIILSREREALEKETMERDEIIGELRGGVNQLKEKKEGLVHVLTETRVNLASKEERLEHLTNKLAEKERLIEETAGKMEARISDIDRGRLEMEAKKEEVSSHRARLEELLRKKDELKREEVLAEERLSALSEKKRSMEGEIRKLNAELTTLQQSRAELSLEVREVELALNNLEEKMIERYGTDIRDHTPPEDLSALDLDTVKARAEELREKIGRMGEVSLGALEEFAELEERHKFLLDQQADLTRSMESLRAAISRINRTSRERFKNTFDEINRVFSENFPRFFNGGRAELRLTGDGDLLESGVDIVAQPPGKKLQNISLLSGGEKALTATALIFSIFQIKPSPFCLLDEVDAPLDDANIDRFNMFVKEMSAKSQFIIITHNKRTMEMADTLYGVTMEEPGVSKVVSVKL